jgi:ribosomal protein S18 acetylase RimI-like enzyme
MTTPADQAVAIRPVTPADLAAVRDVLVATWHATYDTILGTEQVDAIIAAWHSMEALERQRLAPGSSFLVAEVSGRVVATAFARPGADDHIVLSQLYVIPDAQGRGIGRQLLETCLAAFPHATAVQLEVEPRNARAINFYERVGFRVVDTGDGCCGYGLSIHHLVMEKPIP